MIVTDLINVSDPKTVTAFLEGLVVPAEHIEPLLIDILSSNADSAVTKFMATNNATINARIIFLLGLKGLLGKLMQHGPLKFDLQNTSIVLINVIGPKTNQDNLAELMKISLNYGCPAMFKTALEHYTGNIEDIMRFTCSSNTANIMDCFAKVTGVPLAKKIAITEAMFKFNYNVLVVKAFTNHLGAFRECSLEQYYKFYTLTTSPTLIELVLKYCRDEFENDTLQNYTNKVMNQLEFLQKIRR